MANTNVYVDVIARDKASKQFKDVGDSAEKAGGKMSKASKVLGGAAKMGALGLAAGAGAAVVGMAKLTKGAIEDEAAQKKLAKTLTNAAGARKKDIASVESWISKQGVALGITDDELRPAMDRLVVATGDVGKAQKLASLGMDVSAGTGKSLKQVTEALAKAQNGQVAGLSRLGIATKDANGKTKSFAEIQQDLNKKFGGQAKTAANTLEGKMGRLKLVMDETGETIGSKLIPVVTVMATWFLNKGIPAISATWKWLKDKLGPVFGFIGKAIGGMVDRFRSAEGGTSKFRERLGTVAGAVMRVARTVGGNLKPVFTAIGAVIREKVVPLVAQLRTKFAEWQPTINKVLVVGGKVLGWLARTASAILGKVLPIFIKFSGFLLVGLVKALVGVVDKGIKVTAWLIGLPKKIQNAWDRTKKFAAFLRDSFTGILSKVGGMGKTLGDKVWSGIQKVGKTLAGVGGWVWGKWKQGNATLYGRVRSMAASVGGRIWSGITSIGGRLATIGAWAWDRFRGGLDRLRDRFTSAGGRLLSGLVSGLRNQWSKVSALTKKPLNLIIDVAVNPFIRAVNKLPGVDIPRVPGFARGGWTGPGSKYRPAGVVHADEFVINKRSRNAIERRAPGFLDYLNGFASGGRVWPLAGGVPSTYAGHTGVDLNAPNDYGKPVHAVTGGTAYGASMAGSYGNHVNLYTASGVRQIYGHLAGFGKLGRVGAGDVIGYVGSTGNSTGPHLHFEVRPGGTYASALAYLRGASNPKGGGGGLLGSIFGKFKDGASWFKDKLGSLLPKVKGGGLFSASAMKALAKHVMEGVKSKVPGFAKGGIVRSTPGGSLVRVAEGGMDEAIVPITGARRRGLGASGDLIKEVRELREAIADMSVHVHLEGKTIEYSLHQLSKKKGRLDFRAAT